MAQSPLTFRRANPADVAALINLVRSAYRGEESRAGWTTEADLLVDDRIDEAGMLTKITEPQGAVLLAHDETGVLLACCELLRRTDNFSIVYFGMFAVSPRRQGGGIGRQVLERAELYARDAWGAMAVEMCVIWTREELIAWYVRRGYVRTGEKRPFPYGQLVNGSALRDDLYFDILEKRL